MRDIKEDVVDDSTEDVEVNQLECRDVPPDGSCFFSAIGELMSISNGNEGQSSSERRDTNKKLRRMIADEVLENKEKYTEMIKRSEGYTPEGYAQAILHPSMWGGYIDAVILSDLMEVTIIILALEPLDGQFFTIPIGKYPNAVAIRFKVNHYNYLIREDGNPYLTREDVIAYGDDWQRNLQERRRRKMPNKLPTYSEEADTLPKYSDLTPEKARTPLLWECPKSKSLSNIEREKVDDELKNSTDMRRTKTLDSKTEREKSRDRTDSNDDRISSKKRKNKIKEEQITDKRSEEDKTALKDCDGGDVSAGRGKAVEKKQRGAKTDKPNEVGTKKSFLRRS